VSPAEHRMSPRLFGQGVKRNAQRLCQRGHKVERCPGAAGFDVREVRFADRCAVLGCPSRQRFERQAAIFAPDAVRRLARDQAVDLDDLLAKRAPTAPESRCVSGQRRRDVAYERAAGRVGGDMEARFSRRRVEGGRVVTRETEIHGIV
jgi:hypothetical protein